MVVVAVVMGVGVVVVVGTLESNRGDLIASGRFLSKSITSRNPGAIGLSPSSGCSSRRPAEKNQASHVEMESLLTALTRHSDCHCYIVGFKDIELIIYCTNLRFSSY